MIPKHPASGWKCVLMVCAIDAVVLAPYFNRLVSVQILLTLRLTASSRVDGYKVTCEVRLLAHTHCSRCCFCSREAGRSPWWVLLLPPLPLVRKKLLPLPFTSEPHAIISVIQTVMRLIRPLVIVTVLCSEIYIIRIRSVGS